MIARLLVVAPFPLYLPSGAQFNVFECELHGYKLRFFPPRQSVDSAETKEAVKVIVDGMDGIRVDVIQIDFVGEAFNRAFGPPPFKCDPPNEIIKIVLDSYIARLRRITNGAAIHPLEFPGGTWLIQYLNDDGSTIRPENGKAGGIGASHIAGGAIALTEKGWNAMHQIPPYYSPAAWETLLLDAAHPAMPHGSAIVLAETALEVFASYVLNNVAPAKTNPVELWTWANSRKDFYQNPSVEEQYDTLLKIYCGHSLKEEIKLWNAFKSIKNIRNTFVHTGILKVESSDVGPLVASVTEIIEWISQWLPSELRWGKYRDSVEVSYMKRAFPF